MVRHLEQTLIQHRHDPIRLTNFEWRVIDSATR